jgi:hypothetical protein
LKNSLLFGSSQLYCQVKGTWIWVAGSFDEVVASMPDHWFEGAAMVMGA